MARYSTPDFQPDRQYEPENDLAVAQARQNKLAQYSNEEIASQKQAEADVDDVQMTINAELEEIFAQNEIEEQGQQAA